MSRDWSDVFITPDGVAPEGAQEEPERRRGFFRRLRDNLSKNNLQFKAYNCVTCLNRKHMVWAYLSLFWVAFSDIYIRMVASGHWTDWRIF